jgi:hypothetical protein
MSAWLEGKDAVVAQAIDASPNRYVTVAKGNTRGPISAFCAAEEEHGWDPE